MFNDRGILHFAPEQHIRDFVTRHQPREYVQADLFPNNPSIARMDLTALPTQTNYFDLVIANHVLEHVTNDSLALSEIYRTLKPGGYAILQTPFSPQLSSTLEIPALRSPEARLQLYGQEDHVRLYGTDIFARIEASGLSSCVRKHQDALPDLDPFRHGVNPEEPLFLFVKRA
ncbi:MAG: class I SAM-dependent methyltransferase [Gammaproteobacteria bacterium]|nr:class I SAM-dependent methyltransferase [Gammaproteobacteria bacterium]